MSGKIAKGYTVEELNKRMPDDIPPEYITSAHLVYNSPAALAFNSPGAEGFGVKRAGLAVPGSIMLIVRWNNGSASVWNVGNRVMFVPDWYVILANQK